MKLDFTPLAITVIAIVLIFIGLFIFLTNYANYPISFFLSNDDGYYQGSMLMGRVFHMGPGWMNYLVIYWYRIFNESVRPYVSLLFRLFLYLLTYLFCAAFIAGTRKEVIIFSFVFCIPLLFYYVFKPSPEMYMMLLLPIIMYLFLRLNDKKSHYWHYIFFGSVYFIYSQFKPVLMTLGVYLIVVSVTRKRYWLAVFLIILNLVSYKAFNYLSSRPSTGQGGSSYASLFIKIGLINSVIADDILYNKVEWSNPDYRSRIVRDNWNKGAQIAAETGNTLPGVAWYMLKNPSMPISILCVNTVLLLGGTGRMKYTPLLFLLHLAILILIPVLNYKNNNQDYKEYYRMIIAYLILFVLLTATFRYLFPVLPLLYFILVSNIYTRLQVRFSKKNHSSLKYKPE